ncbi:hypothetical protein [Bradyrhizobium sp. CB3481]|uniref:hypothetical protein n=1 Tax=Bradyrhizobium sp. CB3481 TaxID=3039158 RepID=UPI0024B17029|nr:hypothetical protein [Bradyrhizobium sp. CB3481]WFU16430.1 hypothetical protein QA643_36730 [Bradyrhizobium sp. CB3481]
MSRMTSYRRSAHDPQQLDGAADAALSNFGMFVASRMTSKMSSEHAIARRPSRASEWHGWLAGKL